MANPLAGLDTLITKLGKESGSIRAYHGSPYDFDRFDASKIGTGEGAQSYGHGLYFAGNEGVARSYRDNLKGMVDAQVPDELGDELQSVIKEIRGLAERRAAAKGAEWQRIQHALDDAHLRHQDVQHRIRAASYNPGRMYEVEIQQPEQSLLDLDANFVNQSPQVQDALRKLGVTDDDMFSSGKGLMRTVYESIDPMKMEPSEKNVAALLMREGVPGTKYFDYFSRGLGDGTRNYVMFPGTEDSIRILRKYGLLAPMAAGAAMEQD